MVKLAELFYGRGKKRKWETREKLRVRNVEGKRPV
jgi:hypothetical protein